MSIENFSDIQPYTTKVPFFLSTGAVVVVDDSNVHEGVESFTNLLFTIVMEHFEEILHQSKSAPGNNVDFSIYEREIDHIMVNLVKDHYGFLKWILMHLVADKLNFIIESVRESQEKKQA
ncbi:MAG: hypothetical protein PF503_11780 [Desulfobacula sp.]|jgi:hypothetical protein|nr:hypothetical protein [Desulfobacula sp.]